MFPVPFTSQKKKEYECENGNGDKRPRGTPDQAGTECNQVRKGHFRSLRIRLRRRFARVHTAKDQKKDGRKKKERIGNREAQKQARAAGIDVQNDAYKAACRRLDEAEDLYKKGNYKQAVFKFYQAADQFSATHGKKE